MPVNPQYYNPQGALGGLFAPAYIAGYAPSEQAVVDWQSQRGMPGLRAQGINTIEDLRAPPTPQQLRNLSGSTEAVRGVLDPEVLRAVSQNLPYDVQARRDAIAQTVANQDPNLGPSQVSGIGPALEAALRAIPGAWEYFVLHNQVGVGR